MKVIVMDMEIMMFTILLILMRTIQLIMNGIEFPFIMVVEDIVVDTQEEIMLKNFHI